MILSIHVNRVAKVQLYLKKFPTHGHNTNYETVYMSSKSRE